MSVQKPCTNCGKPVQIANISYRQRRTLRDLDEIFCSMGCKVEYVGKKNHERLMDKRVEMFGEKVFCDYCNREMLIKELSINQMRYYKANHKVFCSKECSYKSRKEGARAKGLQKQERELGKIVPCYWCGKPVLVKTLNEIRLHRLRTTGRVYCCKEHSQEYIKQRANEWHSQHNELMKQMLGDVALPHHTVPQVELANALGKEWLMEFPIKLGELWEKGYRGCYNVDIANPALKIAIEVDGPNHNGPKQKALDKKKTDKLAQLGWRVLRFSNSQILDDLDSIVNQIMSIV